MAQQGTVSAGLVRRWQPRLHWGCCSGPSLWRSGQRWPASAERSSWYYIKMQAVLPEETAMCETTSETAELAWSSDL